jgi:hypothetical protein
MTAEATALLHKQRKVLWTPSQYKKFCEFVRTVEGVWPNYPARPTACDARRDPAILGDIKKGRPSDRP